ncbi:MAG TPA: hypothetical protein VFQ45_22005 [Longimicrobium sp.]|nr:hypothetical protein [Longimicrobium sp.]
MRVRAVAGVLALIAVAAAWAPVRAGQDGLDARARGFLEAVRTHRRNAERIAAYFPREGEWRYVHTRHTAGGASVGVWRFPAGETLRAIQGPLVMSFDLHVEGQRVGTLVHQLLLRGSEWRRVRGTRFVPRDAPAGSAIYVQWRRESGAWVIDEIGDESFSGQAKLPSWCC